MPNVTSGDLGLPVMPSKAELVYRNVRARILSGELQPDQRLSMDALARELGVSKIPIREAIGRLESQHLVVLRQHAGPVVAAVDAEQLRGVYLARAAIEPVIARLAAASITGEQLNELADTQDEMRERLVNGDAAGLSSLNYSFHLELAKATTMGIFVEFTETMLSSVRLHRNVEPLDMDNWSSIIDEHDAILAAVRAGDADTAAAAAERHASAQAQHDTRSAMEQDPA
jgi:DNA-binding GntR family transcriptional regulator